MGELSLFNAYDIVTEAIDRATEGKPVGRSKAVYSPKHFGYNITLPYTGGDAGMAGEIKAACNAAMNREYIAGAETHARSIWLKLDKKEIESLLRAAVRELPEAGLADGDTMAGFTLMKMRTLAKSGDRGLSEDARILHAMWLALGITAFHKDKKRTMARLTEACKAIDGMFSGFAPDKRASARAMNGLAGMAAHKLIYAGIIIEEDGYI